MVALNEALDNLERLKKQLEEAREILQAQLEDEMADFVWPGTPPYSLQTLAYSR